MYTAYWDKCDNLENTRNLVIFDNGIIALTLRDNFKLCSSISNASVVTQITTYITWCLWPNFEHFHGHDRLRRREQKINKTVVEGLEVLQYDGIKR